MEKETKGGNKEPEKLGHHHEDKEKNKVLKIIVIGAFVVVIAFFLGLALMN